MLPSLNANDEYIDLTEKAGGRFIVKNDYFHENRGHAVAANAPYGLIAGNSAYRDSSGGIVLAGGGGGGPGATNLVERIGEFGGTRFVAITTSARSVSEAGPSGQRATRTVTPLQDHLALWRRSRVGGFDRTAIDESTAAIQANRPHVVVRDLQTDAAGSLILRPADDSHDQSVSDASPPGKRRNPQRGQLDYMISGCR